MSTRAKYRTIPARTDRFSWRHNGAYGWFNPNGYIRSEGEPLTPNRRDWQTDSPLFAARIFVGFNVGDEPRWTMDDLVPIVKRVRTAQVGVPDSTFLYQRGVYSHQKEVEGKKLVIDEQGAQILLLNVPDLDTSPQAFEQQMVELAEAIADELLQESVIVEIQRGGQTVSTISVVPDEENVE